MVIPANENLLAEVPKPTQGPEQQIGSFKARLGQAYKAVPKANGKSHAENTQLLLHRIAHSRMLQTSLSECYCVEEFLRI